MADQSALKRNLARLANGNINVTIALIDVAMVAKDALEDIEYLEKKLEELDKNANKVILHLEERIEELVQQKEDIEMERDQFEEQYKEYKKNNPGPAMA